MREESGYGWCWQNESGTAFRNTAEYADVDDFPPMADRRRPYHQYLRDRAKTYHVVISLVIRDLLPIRASLGTIDDKGSDRADILSSVLGFVRTAVVLPTVNVINGTPLYSAYLASSSRRSASVSWAYSERRRGLVKRVGRSVGRVAT